LSFPWAHFARNKISSLRIKELITKLINYGKRVARGIYRNGCKREIRVKSADLSLISVKSHSRRELFHRRFYYAALLFAISRSVTYTIIGNLLNSMGGLPRTAAWLIYLAYVISITITTKQSPVCMAKVFLSEIDIMAKKI